MERPVETVVAASPEEVLDLEVRGPELRLRHARSADATALFELASDPEVTEYFSWGPYTHESQARAYIDSLRTKLGEGERIELVIVDSEDALIGVTGLSEFVLRDRRAVVGTWLGRKWWGKGANRESKALVLALAFRGLGLERITAWCGTENARSQVALEKLGFVKEGVLRRWHVHGGVGKDVIAYSMLRSEWEESDLAAEPIEICGAIPPQFLPA